MLLALALLVGAANVYVFSQQWRQRERLVADGLRRPHGVVWMPDDALVVAEAGEVGRYDSGRLTHASAESGRQTIIDDLPSDPSGGPAGIARAANGSLLLVTGPCAGRRCAALLGPDAAGDLVVLADLRARPGAGARARPWGLALGPSPEGAAYVTDVGTDELLRVDTRRAPAEVAALAAFGPGAGPHGLAIGPDGGVYVALLGAGALVRVAPDGAVRTVAEGLAAPIAVGFDAEGRLLALEHAAGRLGRLEPAGGPPTVLASDLDGPTGMAVAPDGRVYVTVRGLAADGRAGQLLQIRRLGPIGPRRLV
jgi:sugar lactone lactonase YvrE